MPHPPTITMPSDLEIWIVRSFDAEPSMIFDCMTRPELVRRWMLGPPGWTMPVCEIDLRIGGAYRYVWRNESGEDMGMGGVFQEIDQPDRLVSTEQFDGAGEPSLVTSAFVAEGGGTTLTTVVLYPSKAARDAMAASGMAQGMEAGYARLDALVAA